MRLVKINDVILNMDNIAVIRGKDTGNGKVNVYAYTAGQEIWLGICEDREDYRQLISTVYREFGESFMGEIVYTEDDDEEEELWK
jgi:hypothetical protein